MSDIMLLGILNIPLDYPMDVLTHTQLLSACREAAKRIESDAIKIAQGEKAIRVLESIGMYFKEDENGYTEWQYR
jgi:hypothetical protein